MSETITRDKLGRTISVGQSVAYPDGNSILGIGTVIKVTPKQVRIQPVVRLSAKGLLKYQDEVVIIEDMYITMYILKNSK